MLPEILSMLEGFVIGFLFMWGLCDFLGYVFGRPKSAKPPKYTNGSPSHSKDFTVEPPSDTDCWASPRGPGSSPDPPSGPTAP
jgi:hypothetical protein